MRPESSERKNSAPGVALHHRPPDLSARAMVPACGASTFSPLPFSPRRLCSLRHAAWPRFIAVLMCRCHQRGDTMDPTAVRSPLVATCARSRLRMTTPTRHHRATRLWPEMKVCMMCADAGLIWDRIPM